MNDKFYQLPQEKQERIIQAGYYVFSRHSYRKAPMNDVAFRAGVSKSLLFHYFTNKKEFYLFLWEHCAQMTKCALEEDGCFSKDDFFGMLKAGYDTKSRLMKQYPDMGHFALKAFFERDEDVSKEIHESYEWYKTYSLNRVFENLDKRQFNDDVDVDMMVNDMLHSATGYLFDEMHYKQLSISKMLIDFSDMIKFWKKTYLKKGWEKDND